MRVGKDRFIFLTFVFCLVSTLGQASLILASLGKLPPQVPLFYSRPWGEAILASPLILWILPLICIVTFLVNLSLALFVFAQNKFLTRTLLTFALFVALLTLYDTSKIISLLI